MTSWSLLEILLRGGAAGILLLSAVQFLRSARGLGAERLAAPFLIGTAAYTLVSTPAMSVLPDAVRTVLWAMASVNSVLFWWFATALFDDDFEWTAWRLAPMAAMAGLFLARWLVPQVVARVPDILVQQALIIAMMVHVLWLALAHRSDDLVEKRRTFRIVFAVLAGVLGLAIAAAEIFLGGDAAPQPLLVVHAAALFVLSLGLTLWVMPAPLALRPAAAAPAPATMNPPDEARGDLARLDRAMQDGAYKDDTLTIAVLAGRLNLPEYRLRRLINGALGFSNFRAFLNSYRVRDARAILSNPAEARRQITEVALDLGYGSVGPFNRAFKAETGLTPTEFRRKALAET